MFVCTYILWYVCVYIVIETAIIFVCCFCVIDVHHVQTVRIQFLWFIMFIAPFVFNCHWYFVILCG